jgi:uncharacterized membrane protein
MPEVLFEAMIVPHRSLSRRGLRLLLGGIALVCVANLVIFSRLHAWPVCGFAGAELVLAALLLRLNALGARASELLLLTPESLRCARSWDAFWERRRSATLPVRCPRHCIAGATRCSTTRNLPSSWLVPHRDS